MGPGATMTKHQPDIDVKQMSNVIRAWLRDLNPLLALVEDVLSQCHSQQEASSPLHESAQMLRPLIRQCRAQIPSEEMVLIWLRMLAEKQQPQ
jgi:hypothetical protein